jgi:hypothetical protein
MGFLQLFKHLGSPKLAEKTTMGVQSLPTELLEAILTLLDFQTLLLAQRVCRQWANCIQESPRIQQMLFFQPASASTSRQQNTFLASKFPYWFPADTPKSCKTSFGAGDMQDFLNNSDVYKRPEASWRRMLVQQPPIMVLGLVERSIAPDDMVKLHRWEIPLQAFAGLRMNMLYDLVVKKAEVAPQYFYFRVLWSQYESFENNMVSLKSEPDPAIYGGRIAVPLKRAMRGADVVVDMWHASHLPSHMSHQRREDTWTWSLVRGLAAPTGDLEVGLVHDMRELKEVNGWSLATDFPAGIERYMMEFPDGCSSAMPLPDDGDSDLLFGM